MLIIVRHGQSQANADGLLVGRVDSPLTSLGRRQAAALGEALAARPGVAARIVTSPLQRAMQTAEAIARAFETAARSQSSADPGTGVSREVPRVVVDPRFVELDYGELDGRAISELPPGLFAHWSSDPAWRPPGGETLLETGARALPSCTQTWVFTLQPSRSTPASTGWVPNPLWTPSTRRSAGPSVTSYPRRGWADGRSTG